MQLVLFSRSQVDEKVDNLETWKVESWKNLNKVGKLWTKLK